MINILYSFIGCFFALYIHDLHKKYTITQQETLNKTVKREAPENIGKFADPLGGYEKYKDKDTQLYRTINNRKVADRIEIGTDSN